MGLHRNPETATAKSEKGVRETARLRLDLGSIEHLVKRLPAAF